MKKLLMPILAVVLAVSGCFAVGPDYRKQEPPVPARFSALEEGSGRSDPAPAAYLDTWWRVFDDSLLDSLGPDYFAQPLSDRLRHIDTQLATLFRDGTRFTQPRDLQPFPILGMPGWDEANNNEIYYKNSNYFRPGRRPPQDA